MNANRTRCDEAFESNLRMQAVVDLASVHATDGFEGSLYGPLEDLMDYLLDDAYNVHPSAEALRKAARDAEADLGLDVLGELLYHRNLLGFVVQFATPVMTKTGRKSWSFTWGYTQGTWVYADSYEEAWKLGIEWADQCRKESKPAPKKRRAKGADHAAA